VDRGGRAREGSSRCGHLGPPTCVVSAAWQPVGAWQPEPGIRARRAKYAAASPAAHGGFTKGPGRRPGPSGWPGRGLCIVLNELRIIGGRIAGSQGINMLEELLDGHLVSASARGVAIPWFLSRPLPRIQVSSSFTPPISVSVRTSWVCGACFSAGPSHIRFGEPLWSFFVWLRGLRRARAFDPQVYKRRLCILVGTRGLGGGSGGLSAGRFSWDRTPRVPPTYPRVLRRGKEREPETRSWPEPRAWEDAGAETGVPVWRRGREEISPHRAGRRSASPRRFSRDVPRWRWPGCSRGARGQASRGWSACCGGGAATATARGLGRPAPPLTRRID